VRKKQPKELLCTYTVELCDGLDLFIIVSTRQCMQSIRIEFAAARVQLEAVVAAQLCSKRVDRNDESSAISLELCMSINAYITACTAVQAAAKAKSNVPGQFQLPHGPKTSEWIFMTLHQKYDHVCKSRWPLL